MKRSELESLRLFQLKRLAQRLNIPGRSTMSKRQLVDALVGKELPPPRKRVMRKPARPLVPRRAAAKPAAPGAKAKAAAPAPRPSPRGPGPAPPSVRPTSRFREPPEHPKEYGLDRVVLLPRDPNWLYAYWEVTVPRYESALGSLGTVPAKSRLLLRVHDVTDLVDPDSGRPRLEDSTQFQTIEVAPMADEWYIKVLGPDRLYCVEFLVQAPDGRTARLATSNIVVTPSDRVSLITEEEWTTGLPRPRRVRRAHGPVTTKWLIGKAREVLTSPRPGSWPGSPGPTPPRR